MSENNERNKWIELIREVAEKNWKEATQPSLRVFRVLTDILANEKVYLRFSDEGCGKLAVQDQQNQQSKEAVITEDSDYDFDYEGAVYDAVCDMRTAYLRTRRSAAGCMSIEAQWRADYAKELAAFTAVEKALQNNGFKIVRDSDELVKVDKQ